MRVPRFNDVIARDNKTYEVIQTSSLGNVLGAGTTPQFASVIFNSANITQFSSFAAVFDQYWIKDVEVWLAPIGTMTSPSYTNTVAPEFYSVVDYDDGNVPTSVNALMEYSNVVVTRPTEGHYIKFRPHMQSFVLGQANGYENIPSGWLDVASTTVYHYGVKLGLSALLSAADGFIDCKVRLTIQFKNVF